MHGLYLCWQVFLCLGGLSYEEEEPVISLLFDIFHLCFGGQQCGPQDRIAMQIAARYGMTRDYKEARPLAGTGRLGFD